MFRYVLVTCLRTNVPLSLLKKANPDLKNVLICGYESAMRSSEIGNLIGRQVHLNVKHISGGIVDYIDLGIFDTSKWG